MKIYKIKKFSLFLFSFLVVAVSLLNLLTKQRTMKWKNTSKMFIYVWISKQAAIFIYMLYMLYIQMCGIEEGLKFKFNANCCFSWSSIHLYTLIKCYFTLYRKKALKIKKKEEQRNRRSSSSIGNRKQYQISYRNTESFFWFFHFSYRNKIIYRNKMYFHRSIFTNDENEDASATTTIMLLLLLLICDFYMTRMTRN